VPASDHHAVVDAVWRLESARVIGALTRMVRDVGLAEDFAHEALVAALEQWPVAGVPDNPGAWLMAAAKRRAIDHFRRRQMIERKHGELAHELPPASEPADVDDAIDGAVQDDTLRLIFIACHPVLSAEARAALTLRLVGGLTTDEIARAYLVPEPTIAQRIVRAKKTLAAKQVPFELPAPDELRARLASVLEVIYLVFNEGYAATAGETWTKIGLCEDALRLARIVAELMPGEAEAMGLAALLEIQASRLKARTTGGALVPLAEQDRTRWDRLLIQRGLGMLRRAELAGPRGPYTLQAAIAACHARAASLDTTDWRRIVALYSELFEAMPSPVVALNRAVAVGMAEGPAAGLSAVDEIAGHAALARYHLMPAVRGDLLEKLGRRDEARAEFERAAALTRNEVERAWLRRRAEALAAERIT
jgi:RNA polymerase sigma factor (sigma-70 family)